MLFIPVSATSVGEVMAELVKIDDWSLNGMVRFSSFNRQSSIISF
jgi:hypothetical protein